jgi:hypothetical protein
MISYIISAYPTCAVTLYQVSGARVIRLLRRVIRRAPLRAKDPKSQGKMMKHLRESQQHTATSHMNSSSTLIAKLFRATPASETNVNHVKLTVFCVKDGAPILATDHPVYADVAKPMKQTCPVLYFVQMMFLTPTVCCRSRLDYSSF